MCMCACIFVHTYPNPFTTYSYISATIYICISTLKYLFLPFHRHLFSIFIPIYLPIPMYSYYNHQVLVYLPLILSIFELWYVYLFLDALPDFYTQNLVCLFFVNAWLQINCGSTIAPGASRLSHHCAPLGCIFNFQVGFAVRLNQPKLKTENQLACMAAHKHCELFLPCSTPT